MRDRNMQAKRTSVQLLSADDFSDKGRVMQDVCVHGLHILSSTRVFMVDDGTTTTASQQHHPGSSGQGSAKVR